MSRAGNINNIFMNNLPEFRKDLVSGDWILVAGASRGKRPQIIRNISSVEKGSKGKCPFENPQKSGNGTPLLWYPAPDAPPAEMENFNKWFFWCFSS